jgi:hypothetical protein
MELGGASERAAQTFTAFYSRNSFNSTMQSTAPFMGDELRDLIAWSRRVVKNIKSMDHRAWEFVVFAENLKKAHAAAPGVSAGTKG